MFSSKHPASNMVGPGVMRTEQQAASLLLAALDRYRGGTTVFLVPVECPTLVRQMYALHPPELRLHFCQVRGQFQPFQGISMPVFLPESRVTALSGESSTKEVVSPLATYRPLGNINTPSLWVSRVASGRDRSGRGHYNAGVLKVGPV